METRLNHSLIREQWKQFLTDIKPDYFVTLTFSVGLPDKTASSSLQFFIRSTYSALPRKLRHKVKGVVAVERTDRGKFAGTYHFHMLFCGVDEDERSYEKKFNSIVNKSAARLKTRNKHPLVPPKNLHVISVWDEKGLADYLTKKGKFPFDRDGLKIWTFDKSGVDHDLPDESQMIWVDTIPGEKISLNNRKGAYYSPIPTKFGLRAKSR